jgi:hypothetical protein
MQNLQNIADALRETAEKIENSAYPFPSGTSATATETLSASTEPRENPTIRGRSKIRKINKNLAHNAPAPIRVRE